MILENLSDLTFQDALPSLYHYYPYAPGDELEWCRLQATTDSFNTDKEAWQYFEKEFAHTKDALQRRCFFLKRGEQQIVGSAMAWYGDGRFDKSYGRLHWVVIHPDFRGQGLGRKLIHFIMHQLSMEYSKAYLTTQTTSYPAINIYLDLGFRPWIENQQDEMAWQLISDQLKHPTLIDVIHSLRK